MSTPKPKIPLTPMAFDGSATRAPSPARPVRSRARPLAMHVHIVPHRHAWSQFSYCANGLMQITVTKGGAAHGAMQTTYIDAAIARAVDSTGRGAHRSGAGNRRTAHGGH